MSAQRNNIRLKTFKNSAELSFVLCDLDKNIEINLDYELDEEKTGVQIAEELHQKGFKNISIVTGSNKREIFDSPWVKKVITDKMPPWHRI